MEFEALLLGLEPLTALAVGVSAVILAPVVAGTAHVVTNAIGKDQKLSESLQDASKNVSDTARNAVKGTIVWGFETLENAQAVFAEAEESFRDLVADAKNEYSAKKSGTELGDPREVEIVSE